MRPAAFYFILLTVLLSATAEGYKVLIFVAPISNSQVILNIRVAELLADAGHDVTILRPQYNPDCTKIKPKSNVKEIRFLAIENQTDWDELAEVQERIIFKEVWTFGQDTKDLGNRFSGIMMKGCESHLKNTVVLDQLRAEKFDIAFTHQYDNCGIGLIHYLGIEAWIWLNSGPLMETVASTIGVPSPPSYVPGIITDMTDRMTYIQRFKNFVGQFLMITFMPVMMRNPQTVLFRRYFGQDFPDLGDLAAKCPLVMANTDELLEFPRPILHKIIYIGGIGMKSPKPLEGDFKDIIDSAVNGAVVISFGSVANSSTMPDHWKQVFLDTFAAFPDIKFIFKYEAKDLKSVPSNTLITPWMPQFDILGHKNVKAFITHGGFNSVLEAVHTATPMITIPLFADQFRNSRLAEKHGFGYYVSKSEISKEKLADGLTRILNDDRYSKSADLMRNMIRKKPTKPEDLIIKWTEYLAEFKQLPNFAVASNELNLIQYFCIDIIVPLLLIPVIFFYVLYRILRCYYWSCCKMAYKEKVKLQ